MLIGSISSVFIGVILVIGFSFFFGYKNEQFMNTCILYSIGSIFSSHWNTLLVEPILDFNYKIMTVSEAASFTIGTLLQYLLVVIVGFNPLLSFGLACLLADVSKMLIVLVMEKRQNPDKKLDFVTKLELVKINGEERYLTDELIELSKQLAGMNFF